MKREALGELLQSEDDSGADLADARRVIRDPSSTYKDIRKMEEHLLGGRSSEDLPDKIAIRIVELMVRRQAYAEATALSGELCARIPLAQRPAGFAARIRVLACACQSDIYDNVPDWLNEIGDAPDAIERNTPQSFSILRVFGINNASKPILEFYETLFTETNSFRKPISSALLLDYDDTLALKRRVKLVSLGEGCYPWMQLNRFGLRSDIWLQKMKSPFNLLASTSSAILSALKDNFVSLRDPSQYTFVNSPSGVPMPFHRGYGMIFNHACGDYFIENGFAKLREHLDRSATEFTQTAFQGRRVYFCIINRPGPIGELEDVIIHRSEDELFRLVFLDTRSGPDDSWRPKHPNVRYVHMPWPSPSYFWVKEFDTVDGIDFDLRVRRIVRDAMLEVAGP